MRQLHSARVQDKEAIENPLLLLCPREHLLAGNLSSLLFAVGHLVRELHSWLLLPNLNHAVKVSDFHLERLRRFVFQESLGSAFARVFFSLVNLRFHDWVLVAHLIVV